MLEQLMDLLKLAYRQKASVYAVGNFFSNFFNDFSLKKIFAGFMVILEMFGSVIFDTPVTPRGSELDLTGYNLVFEDEFNGDSLDYTKWEHWREGVYGPGYLADSQVDVKDGALTLSAEYLEDGKFGPGWYAADIQLKEKYKRGYFEIRCICNSGPDFWSAFWIQADHPYDHEISNGGIGGAELDIVESISSYQSSPFLKNAVTQTVHCNGGDDDVENIDSRNLGKFKGKNIHEEYNTYGLEWTDSEYIFYVNGVETRRTAFSKGVSQVEETVRVSMCTPPVDEITLPHDFRTEFKIDYVKIYQKSDIV